jgi:hypothetical protein
MIATKIRLSFAAALALAATVVLLFVLTDSGSAPAMVPLHHHHCIPQHNRGDHDADNRGGPSDGDGCR